ncbi:MAG: ribosome recycling factor [Nitrospirae bacterium RIFCSPLOW2_12_42_9]|nr:MAG: ribosome recycling factor [Nitrospirae bacterium GWA2_42_11]OGW52961.1 MAG: ribosome recycling factor [Nitrospirae bacterium RIFCSPLOWO2_02_42_7]OGW59103.1 MAG: ribosome recycling factor [Nitrospirae bacterium RIFCSPHIGHO2_02_FULL_42_12]OGW62793.1 MAG: ribosome recycling factor [Nitrospirae bacterium RIFCSPLOW2_12_42_9]HAS18056.1 ribosome recycling factor [Nitrospiraceae bacterium]
MLSNIKNKGRDKMEQTINVFRKELGTIRTGRASLSLFEGLTVDYYGTPTPITQVASLSVPESRLIIIQPWEPRIIPEIEKAIQTSALGLTPANDGKIIRVPIPQLTEERRKEIVRLVKKMAEDSRVAIRNIRRDSNEEIKKEGKELNASEDEIKKTQDEIQKLTDQYIHTIDEILKKKEQEIMEV